MLLLKICFWLLLTLLMFASCLVAQTSWILRHLRHYRMIALSNHRLLAIHQLPLVRDHLRSEQIWLRILNPTLIRYRINQSIQKFCSSRYITLLLSWCARMELEIEQTQQELQTLLPFDSWTATCNDSAMYANIQMGRLNSFAVDENAIKAMCCFPLSCFFRWRSQILS